MRTCVATVSLSGTLRQKLRAAAAAGFDGVELFEQDLVAAPETPERIRDLAAELGLALDLYQPFRDAENVTEEEFARVRHRAEEKFRLMDRLGIRTLLVCSNVATATVPGDEVAADQLGRLADLAAPHGIRLAYEALAWGTFVDDVEHSWRIVEAADRENLGLCLDSFHILSRDWPTQPIAGIPGEKIFFLQLADAPTLSLDVLSWSRHHRVFPGEGGFDLVDFLAQVLRTGYRSPLSLEIFNDSYRQTNAYRTAAEAHRSLLWLQDRTATVLDGAPEAFPATTAEELTRIPAAAPPRGLAWAELRGQRMEDLETQLRQLGFRLRGRHRSKPLQLWEQGGARIVLNEEHATGEAASLASLGFLMDDAEAARRRSQALRLPELARITRPGEQSFPAFLAPDGTEVFYAPTGPEGAAWIREFGETPPPVPGPEPTGTEGADTAAILGIDHVNLAQPRHHEAESTLFHRAALGLEEGPATDVPGPHGLISSRVMLGPDGAVRLPLNVAPDLAAGPGAEHVAFSCTDVVGLARRARDAGLAFLPVPANYYEDLRARYGLPEDRLAELAELDLMYERDAEGAFLHFYTRRVGRVFLEVVQRIGGYQGYGGTNAPVRLAAQDRLSTRDLPGAA